MRASQDAAADQPSSISSASARCRRPMSPTGGFHNGSGGGDDQQRGEQQPQQGQPPRRARRRLFLRRDVEQKPRRRKVDRCAAAAESAAAATTAPARLSRPSRTQRLGESERQAGDHAALPACARLARCGACAADPMRACSASSSSLGGRSVRWMVKLQPSRSVSARIAARWRASRVAIVGAPGFGAAGGDAAARLPDRRTRCGRNRGRSLPPDRRPGSAWPCAPRRRQPRRAWSRSRRSGSRNPTA